MPKSCLSSRVQKYFPGQILAFSGLDGKTDFELGLVGRTCHDGIGIELMHPGVCQIAFDGVGEFRPLIGCDFIEAPQVRMAFMDAYHVLIEGPCRIINKCDAITAVTGGAKTLVCVKAKSDISLINHDIGTAISLRKKWLQGQQMPHFAQGDRAGAYAKAMSILKSQVCTPQGLIKSRWTTPDRWPHRGMWLWDSAFHAIGWRHVDIQLAREMLEAMLGVQRPDGMIPHYADPARRTEITQPPVLALAAKLISDKQFDREWIAAVYPALCRYVTWDLKNRDSDKGGLLEWFIDDDVNCRSGESGMDNSPRFDAAVKIDAVDFNAYIAHECGILSHFAALLDIKDDIAYWQGISQKIGSLLNERCWNEQAGLFVDYIPTQARQSSVLSGAGFLPLLTGMVSSERAGRLAAHLSNPDTFGTDFPIPTVAASDQTHYSKDMWRGPAWINLNWLVAYGFKRCGMRNVANAILKKTTEKVEYYVSRHGTFFEFYDDRGECDPPALLRKRKNNPNIWVHQVIFDYGWSAALYIDMMNELHTND